MRCTNKKKLAALVVLSVLLTGCKSAAVSMEYELDSPVSAYRIDHTNSIADDKAEGFAADLCLRDGQTLSGNKVDLSQALSGVLCDLGKNRIIYGKDENMQLAPASLTKVMTALVALKYADLDTVLTASENVKINESGATLCGLSAGDTMTLDQALHALLMQSANDAAVLIAENIGGSLDGFSDMMNQEAAAIGATNSHFVNPHGLTAEDHYVTAYDMYLIFKEAMQYSEFTQIINLQTYETIYHDGQGNGKEYSCTSTNWYLNGDAQAPDGVTVIGGKTGTTAAARNCLILLAKDSSGNQYVSVILNCSERQYLYQEMTGLLQKITG